MQVGSLAYAAERGQWEKLLNFEVDNKKKWVFSFAKDFLSVKQTSDMCCRAS